MAGRLMLNRMLSTLPRASRAPIASVNPEQLYTDTGGSGKDSTALSSSLAEASQKARSVYRQALRDVPAMRKNFTILEDRDFCVATIRDLFHRHASVEDPKIIDMLVFKAVQELGEIREQWKSRHHVYAYIHRYADKVMRDEMARKVNADGVSDGREEMLMHWKERELVPQEVGNWEMYLNWKEEEDKKFRAFAVENKLFTEEQLDRNAASSSQCTIM